MLSSGLRILSLWMRGDPQRRRWLRFQFQRHPTGRGARGEAVVDLARVHRLQDTLMSDKSNDNLDKWLLGGGVIVSRRML